MDGSAHGAQRDANGRFVAGHSGNPSGKKPGTRNRATVLREALRDGEDAAAARIVIDKALSGNQVAARFVVDRLMPRPRGRTIELDLPAGADFLASYDAAVQAMVSGEITPDEALTMTRVLDGRLRALTAARPVDKQIEQCDIAKPSPSGPFDKRSGGLGEGIGVGRGFADVGTVSSRRPHPHPDPLPQGEGMALRGDFARDLLHSTCILQSPGLAAALRP